MKEIPLVFTHAFMWGWSSWISSGATASYMTIVNYRSAVWGSTALSNAWFQNADFGSAMTPYYLFFITWKAWRKADQIGTRGEGMKVICSLFLEVWLGGGVRRKQFERRGSIDQGSPRIRFHIFIFHTRWSTTGSERGVTMRWTSTRHNRLSHNNHRCFISNLVRWFD